MNYIKYKDYGRLNLDNVFKYQRFGNAILFTCTNLYYSISISDNGQFVATEWRFDTEEECDRVYTLIDKAANCKDLGVDSMEEDL